MALLQFLYANAFILLEKDGHFISFVRAGETEKPVYATREEAHQAFKDLLKEKVWIMCRSNSS